MLYVKDGVNGGVPYFGDLCYVSSNGYWAVTCVAGPKDNFLGNFRDLTYYNINGAAFTCATQGNQRSYGAAGLYLSVPAGYSSVGLQDAYARNI